MTSNNRFYASKLVCYLTLFFLSSVAWAENDNDDMAIKPIKTSPVWVYEMDGEFSDVKESLLLAIEDKGMVVSYNSHSGDMFKRTAKSTGAKEIIYSHAEALYFCKAELSLSMTEEDPHSVMLCPYSIGIYSLVKNPGKIYLSIKPPITELSTYAAIHDLLVGIVIETINF